MSIKTRPADMRDVDATYQQITMMMSKLEGDKADYLALMLARYVRQRIIESGGTMAAANARIIEVMDYMDARILAGEITMIETDGVPN